MIVLSAFLQGHAMNPSIARLEPTAPIARIVVLQQLLLIHVGMQAVSSLICSTKAPREYMLVFVH